VILDLSSLKATAKATADPSTPFVRVCALRSLRMTSEGVCRGCNGIEIRYKPLDAKLFYDVVKPEFH
jgi:hypothetical protein